MNIFLRMSTVRPANDIPRPYRHCKSIRKDTLFSSECAGQPPDRVRRRRLYRRVVGSVMVYVFRRRSYTVTPCHGIRRSSLLEVLPTRRLRRAFPEKVRMRCGKCRYNNVVARGRNDEEYTQGQTMALNMNYQTFEPHTDLAPLVKCYWTLQVPAQKDVQRQLIIPDGCIEMAFVFGDEIKRYTSEDEFIIGPREVIIGQITETTYIEPTGYVDSFAVRFYPYGFAAFVSTPLEALANTETPLAQFFGEETSETLAQRMNRADDTAARIAIVEEFLLSRLSDRGTIDTIVRTTIETMLATKGSGAINAMLRNDASKRRQLEREFKQKIGISPKQLGKVIRLQAALKRVLNRQSETLTEIAYESEYYDQAHFIKDFKEFTGITPKKFLGSEQMALSSLLYK